MAHVFISYRRKNKKYAEELKERLEKARLDVWWDQDIYPGDKWEEKIDTAIEDSCALVVVLTPTALESHWITYEWAYALFHGKDVFPIEFEKVDHGNVHEKLKKQQIAPYTDSELQRVISRLHDIAGIQFPGTLRIPKNSPGMVSQAALDLESGDFETCRRTIDNLTESTHPKVFEFLKQVPQHHLPYVGIYAAIKLVKDKQYHDEGVIQKLAEGLADTSRGLREPSKDALAAIGSPAVPTLMKVLSSETKADGRKSAAELLEQIGDTRAVEPLVAALQDSNAEVRQRTAKALGRIGDDAAAPELERTLLHDTDGNVRRLAAWALEKINSKNSLFALIEALADTDASIHQPAVAGLKKFNPSELTHPLLDALKHKNTNVRLTCASLLQRANDPTIVPQLVGDIRTEKEGDVQDKLHKAIFSNSDKSDLAFMLDTSLDVYPHVRYTAAMTLGKIGGVEAGSRLIEMLSDEEWRVRKAATDALGNFNDESTVKYLIRALDDPQRLVQLSAADALKRNGTPEALEAAKLWWQNQGGQQ